ncbi:hypothetical protein A1O3_10316 [Capronia epimyces CBS 606.96]|uniref:Organic solute transporter Ostalpha-domain-containing protein n=1 Tax=Capronia epimyces CBS 606.96 TaxID=1182542 RepID=W9XA86_9EURO|nr:uncharacterized protein A1O3_10316 [Capronia epimyces CBS 606.96]EXJ77158.1 hypothetical protein A1O3_10316 [Capronia epimyces CBS 606.96]
MPLLGPRSTAAGSFGCPLPDHLEQIGGGPFVGNLTFYHFNMIVSGSCTAVVLIAILGLMGRHAMHMSNPDEQLKIMRICNLIPSYQILSFISICFPNSYVYLQGFTEVFQGVALYAFLMLLCDYLAPSDGDKVEFFSSLEVKRQWQPKKKRNGIAFLTLTWYSVLQYPVITWIAAVSQVVTQSLHVYCLDSTAAHFAHIWLQVITSLSTSVAVNAILQFYVNLKEYMTEHRPLLKLTAFKLIVGVVLVEKILFLILTGTKVLTPSASMTYIDVMMGLPTMVICVQMVPLSFLVLYAYRTTPYEISDSEPILRAQGYHAVESAGDEDAFMGGSQKRYQGGPWGLRAWAGYLNPLQLFREVMSAHAMIHKARNIRRAHSREQAQEDANARYKRMCNNDEQDA